MTRYPAWTTLEARSKSSAGPGAGSVSKSKAARWGAAGEGAVEEGVGDGAVEGGGDDAGVAADDGAPGLLVGVGGALADAGGAVEAGEHAAGGHKDDELLLMEKELGERVGAAGLGGVGDEGAGGKGAGAAVGDLLGGGAVVGDAGGVHVGRHGDDDGRDAVTLEEAAPGLLAQRIAQEDGHGGIVDVAGAHQGDNLAFGDGVEAAEVEGLGGGGVPVPEAGDEVAAEIPGVEELEAGEAQAVVAPEGTDVGVAAEEGGGEALDGGEEVALLGLAVGLLKEGGLLVGQGLVEAFGTGSDLGADGPIEVDQRGGAALGADHERGVALLDVLIEPLEADVVAAAGGVEDHLGAADGEPAQGVVALEEGVGLAVGAGAHRGGQDDGSGGFGFHRSSRLPRKRKGRGRKSQPRRSAAWMRRARAEARSLWPSSERGAA